MGKNADYHNPPCFYGKVAIAIVKASFQIPKKARANVKVTKNEKIKKEAKHFIIYALMRYSR